MANRDKIKRRKKKGELGRGGRKKGRWGGVLAVCGGTREGEKERKKGKHQWVVCVCVGGCQLSLFLNGRKRGRKQEGRRGVTRLWGRRERNKSTVSGFAVSFAR